MLALKALSDDVPTAVMAVLAQPARKRKLDPTIDGDDGGLPPLPAPVDDVLALCDESPSSSSSSSSSSGPASKSDAASGGAGSIDGDDGGFVMPGEICGMRVKQERHEGGRDAGLRVKCPIHPGCSRFRSLRKNVDWFGPKAPLYFLGAWIKAANHLPVEQHRGHSPPMQTIREFVASLE